MAGWQIHRSAIGTAERLQRRFRRAQKIPTDPRSWQIEADRGRQRQASLPGLTTLGLLGIPSGRSRKSHSVLVREERCSFPPMQLVAGVHSALWRMLVPEASVEREPSLLQRACRKRLSGRFYTQSPTHSYMSVSYRSRPRHSSKHWFARNACIQHKHRHRHTDTQTHSARARACVCVCVRERERGKERKRERERERPHLHVCRNAIWYFLSNPVADTSVAFDSKVGHERRELGKILLVIKCCVAHAPSQAQQQREPQR